MTKTQNPTPDLATEFDFSTLVTGDAPPLSEEDAAAIRRHLDESSAILIRGTFEHTLLRALTR